MCGRFTQQRPTAELAALFEAEPLVDDSSGHFNLAPTDPAAVVVERGDRRALTSYAWGLIPHLGTDPRTASRRINARAETLATSAAFRESFRRRRCIVPADGFYEWQRDGTVRRPFYFHRSDGAPLALAACWSGWRDPATDTSAGRSRIITTTPNDADRRAPRPDAGDPGAVRLGPVARPDPPGRRRAPRPACPVTERAAGDRRGRPARNNVRNDGPELIRPVAV